MGVFRSPLGSTSAGQGSGHSEPGWLGKWLCEGQWGPVVGDGWVSAFQQCSSAPHGVSSSGANCVLQVVLPTFILERRSLLEMYADFFAHPDLFVR